eukprot:TRINITY_DN1347_c0_g1_i1.p1 TRINITY_DN1347_c0_g1~~TRINITY_DN1347_c0_g1_i1.p1  ORF type:complete len:178 (+),score=50.14 TRINITY_DN1347_c0_g1_i1:26-559(+)
MIRKTSRRKPRLYRLPSHDDIERAKKILNSKTNPTVSHHSACQVRLSKTAGFGVYACATIPVGTFICEYAGELISEAEALNREEKYIETDEPNDFLFFIEHKRKKYAVDPTSGDSSKWGIGKYINHSRKSPNLEPELIDIDGKPHIALIARTTILQNEELFFDYGDRKESIEWLWNS